MGLRKHKKEREKSVERKERKKGSPASKHRGSDFVVIKGLAEHKDSLGAPLCPCRHYDDKAAEVSQGFWNCPCVPMRERKECHCMLFLTRDNDFAGQDQTSTSEEIKETTANM
ncbi:ferredoxin-thioredoxin reductase catalytic chain, chloroplastic-like [Hibiscus syriacus]|uniref:ferredoxin-thioredoxin reductase catalytic chain, chloroplastic-like n=1 Tax=Hibiscus syriacus TaxID=106335 RepID=UPI001924971F|nr:ferredoxin-thioredoxin reductase catalytic chain, chloroplastic-like [Hibiscus syriacus]